MCSSSATNLHQATDTCILRQKAVSGSSGHTALHSQRGNSRERYQLSTVCRERDQCKNDAKHGRVQRQLGQAQQRKLRRTSSSAAEEAPLCSSVRLR